MWPSGKNLIPQIQQMCNVYYRIDKSFSSTFYLFQTTIQRGFDVEKCVFF